MNTVFWVLQIILSIKLISAAYTHGLRQDKTSMQEAIQKFGDLARPMLAIAASGTLLGAAGLVIPGALGVMSWLTPWIAAVVAGMLLASIVLHVRGREQPKIWVSLILCAMAVLVAYGRWVMAPF
jgi:protein-S-isoprenylcysteine O-methyltransferase Ste14